MKHKYRYRTAVILTALVLLVPVAMNIIDDDVREEEDDGESPIGNYDDAGYRDVERITEVPEGYIGIYTPEEMNLIGKDPDHPLDGKYILMADLDMTDAVPEMRYTDHSALQLKYRLYNGAFQIWIGLSSDAFYSIDGGPLKPIILSRLTTSYSNVSDYTISEDHTLTVIGRDSEYKPFAFRVTINASTISTTAKTLDPISSGIGNFVPIGTFDEPFTGMFNGNGHMISGMEIWGIDDPTGIFGYIHGATIMNLRADAEIWSADPSLLTAMISRESESCATGGIVGVAVLSTIYNCKFSGEISFLERSYHSYIGGAIGSAASSTLANLESEGIISGGIDRSSSLGVTVSIGGIVGSIKAMNQDRAMTVVGCCNRMSIEVDRISASTNGAICCGGIFGTTIQNDYCPYVLDSVNYGSINVNTNVQLRIGGIGGYAYWTNASGCANEGDISVRTSDNTAHVGGIFAQLQGSVSDSFNRGDIDIKSAATTTDVSAGGVCGMTFAAQVLKCYNEGDIVISGSIKPASGYIYSGGIIGYPSGAFSSGAYVIKDSYNAGDLHVSVDSAGYLLMMGGIAGYLSTNAKAGNSYNAGSVTKEGPVAKVEGINGVAGSVYY
ncbi:MAG: hypothetical protein LBV13_01990, partial [Methanomassiliicoccaceae archaeon]|nr:hypothetical protein [Methanomassiliicoccaceae archaeon]